jgi:hypothetical protein
MMRRRSIRLLGAAVTAAAIAMPGGQAEAGDSCAATTAVGAGVWAATNPPNAKVVSGNSITCGYYSEGGLVQLVCAAASLCQVKVNGTLRITCYTPCSGGSTVAPRCAWVTLTVVGTGYGTVTDPPDLNGCLQAPLGNLVS